MSSFTQPLTVQKIKKGRWRVARPFRYYIGEENSPCFVDVEKGFETDFASVPRLFWTILPPDGTYTQAAVLHDFLYNTRRIYVAKKDEAHSVKIKRQKADQIFLEAMKVLKVAFWKRHVMHKAVRAFGWLPWRLGKNE